MTNLKRLADSLHNSHCLALTPERWRRRKGKSFVPYNCINIRILLKYTHIFLYFIPIIVDVSYSSEFLQEIGDFNVDNKKEIRPTLVINPDHTNFMPASYPYQICSFALQESLLSTGLAIQCRLADWPFSWIWTRCSGTHCSSYLLQYSWRF